MAGQHDRIDQEQLNRLLARANDGDGSALPALREAFNRAPHCWEQAGNLALQAERALLRLAAGRNDLAYEAMERKADALRAELGGSSPAPLERLLVDRIVACWLQVNAAERTCAGFYQNGGSLPESDFHQRRLDAAQRRYLSAMKTLAQVRRLLTPSVQVNIAEQQVNVAG